MSHSENLFLSIYKTNHLNPTFDVIYQESVRGNHILFSPQDVESWDHLGKQPPCGLILEKVSKVFLGLFEKASYREMCDLVDELEEGARYWLYRLYINFIDSLKLEVKASFN